MSRALLAVSMLLSSGPVASRHACAYFSLLAVSSSIQPWVSYSLSKVP